MRLKDTLDDTKVNAATALREIEKLLGESKVSIVTTKGSIVPDLTFRSEDIEFYTNLRSRELRAHQLIVELTLSQNNMLAAEENPRTAILISNNRKLRILANSKGAPTVPSFALKALLAVSKLGT